MTNDFGNLKEGSFEARERQKYVAKLFDDLARDYDRFNRWVSFFRDEAWRRETIALLKDRALGTVLDLAAGTGDLAQAAARQGAPKIHVFDISFEMLGLARTKLANLNSAPVKVALERGSANLLPFRDQVFDGIVSGFAMRNVFHFLDQVLAEMYRVLLPGGRFAILELSRPANPLVRLGFKLHMKTIMPLVGRIATGGKEPFDYLYQTTMTFLSPNDFGGRLQKAGFEKVGWKTYLLGGIAIHFGEKGKPES